MLRLRLKGPRQSAGQTVGRFKERLRIIAFAQQQRMGMRARPLPTSGGGQRPHQLAFIAAHHLAATGAVGVGKAKALATGDAHGLDDLKATQCQIGGLIGGKMIAGAAKGHHPALACGIGKALQKMAHDGQDLAFFAIQASLCNRKIFAMARG